MGDPIAKNLFEEEFSVSEEKKPNLFIPSNNEPMKVFLRIRPFSEKEQSSKEDQGSIVQLNKTSIEVSAPKDSFTFKSGIRGLQDQTHTFSFSNVFGTSTQQKVLFDSTMLPLVKDVLDGQNALVFTYGVTNAGKTYTIQGTPRDGGMLPRSLDVVFNSISNKQYLSSNLKPKMFGEVQKLSSEQEMVENCIRNAVINAGEKENVDLSVLLKLSSTLRNDTVASNTTIADISSIAKSDESCMVSEDFDIAEELRDRVADATTVNVDSQGNVRFAVWVSFMEIYNEQIYDLLDPTPTGKGKKRQVLKMGDDKNGNPYVKGLKDIFVTSADEAYKVLRVGQKNRHIASTKLNQHSSRSHSIFTIKLLKVVNVDEPHVARISRISIVDLAGSERYCRTHTGVERLKEASNINNSIMTLGKCIHNLRYNQMHRNHPMIVPFRESKLTRLFQSFFLGKGKACMIVNISPCASVFDETYHVLKFSAIAKQIQLKAQRATELWKVPPIPKIPSTPSAQTPSRSRQFPPLCIVTPSTSKKRSLEDPTAFSYDELVNIAKELRDKVKEERRKNAIMEKEIRTEVCKEMSEQLVEIEHSYNERLEEQKENLEDLCDKRIELLTKTVNKCRKRKKNNDDDDDYVSSVYLHAEKMKCKEKDETIVALKAQIAEMENKHEFYKQTRTPEHHSKAIEQLQNELTEAKETLVMQKEHIEDLAETMSRATEAMEEKDEEIDKLKEVMSDETRYTEQAEIIKELKQLLEATTKELDIARVKMDNRDMRIRELESICDTKRADNKELTETLDQQKEWLQVAKEKIENLQKELSETSSGSKEQERELHECKNELEKTKAMLHDSKEEVVCLQFEKEELDAKVEKFSRGLKEHQSVLADNELLIEQLNSQITTLKSTSNRELNSEEKIPKEDKKEEIKLHMELEAAESKLKDYSEKITRLENQMKASEGLMMPPGSPAMKAKRGIVTASPGVTSCLTPDKSLLGMKNQSASTKKQYESPYSPSATKSTQQHTIRNLQKLLDDTTKTLEKKNALVVSKTNHIQNLESQIKTLENKTQVNEMKRLNTDLSNKLVNLQNEVEKLKFELDNQEENIGGLEDQIEQKSVELQNTQAKLDIALQELKVKEEGLDNIGRSNMSEMAALREIHQNEVSHLTALLASKEEKHSIELQEAQKKSLHEINEVEGRCFDLQQTCEKLRSDLSSLEISCDEHKAQAEELKNCFEKKKSECEHNSNIIAELESSNKKLKSEIEEVQLTLEKISRNLEDMTFERDGAVNRAVKLAEEVSKYQDQIQEHLSSSDDRIAGYKERVDEQQREIGELEESKRALTKQIKEKTNEVITLQDEMRLMRDNNEEAATLTKKLQQLEESISVLNESLQQKTIEIQTLEKSKQSQEKEKSLEINNLQLQLQKKAVELQTLTMQIESMDIDKEELKSKIINKEEEIEALSTAVNKYESEVKEREKLFKESQEQRKRLEEMNNGSFEKLLKLEQEKQESSAIIADLKRIKEQQEKDLSELRESVSKQWIDDTVASQIEENNSMKVEIEKLKDDFNKAAQDNNCKMALHEKEMHQREQDIKCLNDELMHLRKTLLDRDKDLKQLGDEKKKVLEQLESSFADLTAQKNGYELKLKTLKEKIENPTKPKRSNSILQKSEDKENEAIVEEIDPDFITPLKKIKEEVSSSTGRGKRGSSTRCSTRRRTARSSTKNVSYNETTPENIDTENEKSKSSKKSTTRKSRKVLEEVTLEPDNVAVSDDSNLPDDDVLMETSSKLELSAVEEEDGDYSIVMCKSIALSPFSEVDIPDDGATKDLEIHEEDGCDIEGLVNGEFIAVACHDQYTHKPLIGRVLDVCTDHVRLEWWMGGYSKQWKEMEVEGKSHIELLPIEQMLLPSFRMTATKRLPADIKRKLQREYQSLALLTSNS